MGKLKVAIMGETTRVGGGQMYLRSLIRALSDEEITLISGFKNDPLGLGKIVNSRVDVGYEYEEGRSYLRNFINVRKLRRKLKSLELKYDLTINNHPNIFLKNCEINIMHGFSFLNDFIDENGEIVKKFPYYLVKMLRLYKIYNKSNFLYNSKYSQNLSSVLFNKIGIEHRDLGILYPVCDTDIPVKHKRDGILLFGRINKEKNIDRVLDVIVGQALKITVSGALNKGDGDYYEKLKKRYGKKVIFVPNPDEKTKRELLGSSMIYIHSNKKENFGITVTEAMRGGCIPIVPKSGAPWIDILQEGKFGLGYDDYSEIPQCIEAALRLDNNGSILRAEEFNFTNFRKNLRIILSKI